jgi:hypothetical protein
MRGAHADDEKGGTEEEEARKCGGNTGALDEAIDAASAARRRQYLHVHAALRGATGDREDE